MKRLTIEREGGCQVQVSRRLYQAFRLYAIPFPSALEIVALEVTGEKVCGNSMFKSLMEATMLSQNIVRVLADGSYDARANFTFLAKRGADATIKVRRNAVPKLRCFARKQVVAEQLNDYGEWWERHRHGYRWRVEDASPC
ncbi:MAG: hypothetical protein QXH91_02405 [Candidatus Bathyarchaeia archaeon]